VRTSESREGENMMKYFLCTYEKRIMKSIKFALKGGRYKNE
jgi:hypothetical protein